MAAVVVVQSYHESSPGTPGNRTNQTIAFKRVDNDSVDPTDTIPIPSTGTAYSWRKYTKIEVVSGLTGTISNIRWFAEPAPEDWANSCLHLALTSPTYTNPTTAGPTDETTPIGSVTTDNADVRTSASPLAITGSIAAAGTGTQHFVVQQMGVKSTATSGMKTGRKFIYRYDET